MTGVRRHDLRLVIPAGAAWLAALALVFLPEAAIGIALMSWVVGGFLGAAALIMRRLRPVWKAGALSIVAIGVVTTAIAAALPARAPVELVRAAHDGVVVELAVRLDSAPRAMRGGLDGEERSRMVGTAVSVLVDGKRQPLDVPVVVFAEGSPVAGFGDTVSVRGRPRETGSGERAAFLVSAVGELTIASEAPPWLSWTKGLRAGFADTTSRLPGEGGALLPGLAIGDVSAVGTELDEAMKVSALSHVTAVSGANCAIVTGLAFALAAMAGAGRRLRGVVALLALVGFVILVTPDSSVVRAAIMAAIVLCSLASGRPGRGLSALALAVIVLLTVDPWKAVDYGFALSVLATAGLLVIAGPLAALLARFMPLPLATTIAVPLAAQIACQPVLILLDSSLPLYGVAANVLIEPAAPLATILGLAACLILPVLPPLGTALAWLAWLPSAWIARVALTVDELPASRLPWVGGWAGVGLAAAVLALVGIRVLVPSGTGWQGGRGRRLTAFATVALLVGMGCYGGVLAGGRIADRLSLPGDWQIAACDIGQGDAVLVRDGNSTALVDTGREPEPLRACLDRFGVDRIDLLVLTHFDLDHVGGLDAVIGHVDDAIVGRAVEPGDERDLAKLRGAGARVTQAVAPMRGALGAIQWRVLWPSPAADPDDVPVGNPGSVTVEFEGGGIRSLFLGDLGEQSQAELLATGRVRPVDVVKVAHHGSGDQSPALYERLGAAIGLISVGERNGYGHPTPSLLGLLAKTGTTGFRTDRQGHIVVSPPTAESPLRVWTERDPQNSGQATFCTECRTGARSFDVSVSPSTTGEHNAIRDSDLQQRRVRRCHPRRARRPGDHGGVGAGPPAAPDRAEGVRRTAGLERVQPAGGGRRARGSQRAAPQPHGGRPVQRVEGVGRRLLHRRLRQSRAGCGDRRAIRGGTVCTGRGAQAGAPARLSGPVATEPGATGARLP